MQVPKGGSAQIKPVLLALAAAVVALAAVAAPGRAHAEASPAGGSVCEEIAFRVSLAPAAPAVTHLVGTLCASASGPAQTLQVLVHGATYHRTYWDFPADPNRYSYVRYARAAGFATLALDRVGAGASDHPLGTQLDTVASAFTIHQVVSALRNGTAATAAGRPVRFDRIVLVGHSFGSYISWVEAGTYGDVDGVVASGASHLVDPPGMAAASATLYPAPFDPRFASAGLPDGYFTTLPGTRAQNFYFLPGADPAVIALDEATKDVVAIGMFSDFVSAFGRSRNIHVPVLGVVGDYDTLACALPSCSASGSFADERREYPADACFTSLVVPATGHDLNLHRTAPVWFAAAQAWATARVGARADRPAPLPCP